jgi:type I restriction enzyme S subunit
MSFPRYPDYKDSGVEWLGEVPEYWELLPLKRVGRIRYGIGEPPAYVEDGVRLIRATNVRAGKLLDAGMVLVNPADIPSQRILWLEEGDIIVVRSGAYTGDSSIVPAGYGPCIAGFDMVLRIHGADPKYIQYALLSAYLKDHQIELKRMRAAQPHLNAEELGECILVMPPVVEQSAIATFLDRETAKIDALITEQQRLIELLQEKRQAVISHAVTKGLNPNVPMKDSGVEWLGEVPEHWEISRLGWIADQVNDINHEMPVATSSGIPFLSAKDLDDNGRINFDGDVKLISEDDFERLSKKIRPESGDIIYTRIGTIGRAALVNTDQRFLVSYSCCVIRIRHPRIHLRFLRDLLASDLILTESKARTRSMGQPDLGLGEIRSFPIPVPPLEEQKLIDQYLVNEIGAIDEIHVNTSACLKLLQERRAALVSAAVTGQIDVRGLVPEVSAA